MLVFRPSSDFVLLDSQYDLIPFSPATLLDLSKISLSFLNSYSGTAHPQDVWTSSIERSNISLNPQSMEINQQILSILHLNGE